MILITGGAHQGKSAYIRKMQNRITLLDGAVCGLNEIMQADCIAQYHLLIRRMTDAGLDPEQQTELLCKSNPDCIVLLDEIGSGIIPMERTEREWREHTGRCGCILASHAETVIRMVCGIPTALKGELP